MNVTSKLPKVGTTIFTTMSNLSRQHNALNLSQGFPNFDVDEKLTKLVKNAMNGAYNQYAPMLGAIQLRESIVNKIAYLYKTDYDVDGEVVITSGATQALFSAISAFVRKDDEVISFKPAYDAYEPTVELQGGKVVPIQLHHPHYKVDWKEVAEKITSKTKMIVVNTPQNPCGTTFSKEDMLELQRLTTDTNIIVLSDEVYEHMVFDGEQHQSVCRFTELKKRSLITASFGKTFHATGWKMGYCLGPKELMKEFIKVHQFTIYSVNHPVQMGLAEYMKHEEHYIHLSEFYQEKRDFFLSAIQSSRFSFVPSQATYFQLLDYSAISDEGDVDFARRLTEEFKIASIPLSVFNENQVDFKALRFCFAKTEETLSQAAEILNKI
jgi:methionine aminotransferase